MASRPASRRRHPPELAIYSGYVILKKDLIDALENTPNGERAMKTLDENTRLDFWSCFGAYEAWRMKHGGPPFIMLDWKLALWNPEPEDDGEDEFGDEDSNIAACFFPLRFVESQGRKQLKEGGSFATETLKDKTKLDHILSFFKAEEAEVDSSQFSFRWYKARHVSHPQWEESFPRYD